MSDARTVGSADSEALAGERPVTPAPCPRWTQERLLSIHHWTNTLMSFRVSRPPAYRFVPGHYARVGLGDIPETTEWRPLSIVSGPAEDFLEFFAVLVPAGAFSNRLAKLQAGDPVRIEKASYGFLTVNQMARGTDLWLLASGTGLGPFVSILRDGATWQAFEHIVLVHSVRYPAELAYREEFDRRHSDSATASLRYLPIVTREQHPGALSARITQLIEDGQLEQATGVTLDKERSRVMVCGNPEMVKTLRAFLSAKGYQVSRRGVPGQMAFEKYW
jgi:ferredoxin--NADP+ reductase